MNHDKIILTRSALSGVWSIIPQALNQFMASMGMDKENMPAVKSYDTMQMDGVAVIPLCGVMMSKPNEWDKACGACSTADFAVAMSAAASDPTVAAILIDCDSPGGSVAGCSEAAESVRNARAVKPVVAYSGNIMASAAYWVCSQADYVCASKLARVGSVGVFGVIRDTSAMYKSMGIESTLVRSGSFKGEGVDGLPVSKEFIASIQALADKQGAAFRADVSACRSGVKAGDMQGQDFMGEEAVNAGMIDAVCGFNRALADAGTLARLRSAGK
jgi:capsid assembly protease